MGEQERNSAGRRSFVPAAWHQQLKSWAGTLVIVGSAVGWMVAKYDSIATVADVARVRVDLEKATATVDGRLDAATGAIGAWETLAGVAASRRESENLRLLKFYAGEMAVRNEPRPGFSRCARDVRRLAEERFELYLLEKRFSDPLAAALHAASERIVLECR